jgi:hypothetical protein
MRWETRGVRRTKAWKEPGVAAGPSVEVRVEDLLGGFDDGLGRVAFQERGEVGR